MGAQPEPVSQRHANQPELSQLTTASFNSRRFTGPVMHSEPGGSGPGDPRGCHGSCIPAHIGHGASELEHESVTRSRWCAQGMSGQSLWRTLLHSACGYSSHSNSCASWPRAAAGSERPARVSGTVVKSSSAAEYTEEKSQKSLAQFVVMMKQI